MRVLVCGDRNWSDRHIIEATLFGLWYNEDIGYLTSHLDDFVVIEGGASGADALAGNWADLEGPKPAANVPADVMAVKHERYPAEWAIYGKAAGPLRNQRMLDEGKPDLVLAFHDDLGNSKGTADMVRRAHAAGVLVYVIGHTQTPLTLV